MLTLYFTPGACSMAAHIVLEESGENYEAKKVDLAGGEQRTEAYLKINPLGRVPALLLDNGEPLAENTAILPFLGKRFNLWPEDALAEAKALSLIGFFASSVHVSFAHVSACSKDIGIAVVATLSTTAASAATTILLRRAQAFRIPCNRLSLCPRPVFIQFPRCNNLFLKTTFN